MEERKWFRELVFIVWKGFVIARKSLLWSCSESRWVGPAGMETREELGVGFHRRGFGFGFACF